MQMKKIAIINNYTNDNLRLIRSIKELDPFREDTYPDDIMVIFPLPEDSENEDSVMEGMWVRAEKYKEGVFYGTLMNTPNDERFNLKTGDEVRFIYYDDQTPVCLAIPMKDKW